MIRKPTSAAKSLKSAEFIAFDLETIGRHLGLIGAEEHRALGDATLVKDVFSYLVGKRPTIRQVDKLYELSSPLAMEMFTTVVQDPPLGYEELWLAITEQQAVVIEYWAEVIREQRVRSRHGVLSRRGGAST